MKSFLLLSLIVSIMSENPNKEKSIKNTLLSIYESLLLKYPKVEISPEDFITHLSPGSPNFNTSWLSISLTVFFGLLV